MDLQAYVIQFIKMTKVALIFFVGCIFFGLLKLVASDQLNVEERDLRVPNDVIEDNEQQERIGSHAKAISFAGGMPRPKPHPLPIPNQTPSTIRLTECYVCSDCPKVLPNTTSKMCPLTLNPSRRGKCVIYAEQYKHMKRPWYIRGCASDRGTCTDIKKAHGSHEDIVTLVMCKECEGDRCNVSGASRCINDITIAIVSIVVTPLMTKYTLS